MQLPSYYRVRYILVLLPLCVGFSTIVGTPHTLSDGIVYAKFFLNLFVGGGMWAWYLMVILRMDQRMPWEQTHHPRRWMRQLGIALPIGAVIYILGISIRNILIDWAWQPHLAFYTDLPIALVISIGIHYLHQQWYLKQVSDNKRPSAVFLPSDLQTDQPLTICSGATKFRLYPHEIALVIREDQLNYLLRFDGQKLRIEQSLSAIESMLPAPSFFRLNRQCLVNREAIQAFKVQPNRHIAVELRPPISLISRLNKNRSAAFKKWLQASPSGQIPEMSGS